MNTLAVLKFLGRRKWCNLQLRLIVDGKTAMLTRKGVRKGNELIWYDDKALVSVMATTDDDFQISLSHIPSKGGDLHETDKDGAGTG